MRPDGYRLTVLMEEAIAQMVDDGEVSRKAWKKILDVYREIKVIREELK